MPAAAQTLNNHVDLVRSICASMAKAAEISNKYLPKDRVPVSADFSPEFLAAVGEQQAEIAPMFAALQNVAPGEFQPVVEFLLLAHAAWPQRLVAMPRHDLA